ncbi:serine hydrolase [soil metagenome]
MTTPTTIDWTAVSAQHDAVVAKDGVAGIAIAVNGDVTADWNSDRLFRAASTIKIAVMIEIFHAEEQGKLSRSDVVALKESDRVPGSGVLAHLHEGLNLIVDDLLYLMISISDNSATNMLVDLVGLDAINDGLVRLGIETSKMRRRMLGRTPLEGEPENWIIPRDFAVMVQAIVNDTAASPSSCAAMRDLLATQQNTDRIARFLPEGTTWGSKTGSLPNVVNDVGFITTDQGTIVIAVFTEGLSEADGEKAIGEIARAAWVSAGILPE